MQAKPLKSDPVKTILVITVGMLIVHLAGKWMWPLYLAIAVGLIGVLSDYLAAKVDFLWMKLSWVLSKIVPNILLSAVFYLFLTPIALLSRLLGEKNPLTLKNTEASMFKDHAKGFDKTSFEKPW